jgi:cytochrome bd-type quinol oxidase subunit 1
MQQINFPFVGNSVIMAVVILIHVFFAFVAVGGICLAFASEWLGRGKNSAFHDRFARGYIKFLSDMMKLNGVLGVAIVVLTIGLFPAFASKLYNIFFWPLILEASIFMAMMALTVIYLNTWETMENRGLHLAIGGFAAASAVAAGVVINAAHAFMLTPGGYFEAPGLLKAVFNPSMPASSIHLLIPCVVNAAMFAYIYALVKLRRVAPAESGYYSWLADYSGTIFAVGILLQPLSGLSFLFTLKAVNPSIFTNIVSGFISKFFWTMAGLATVAVTASIIYMLSKKKQRAVLLAGGLAALTAFSFGGYTRERARKPYLIYGHMYMTGALVAASAKPAAAAPETKTAPVKIAAVKPGAGSAPVKTSAAVMSRDMALEKYGCLVCHSYKGKGGTFGPVLDAHLGHHSKEKLKNILRNPAPTMPPFDGTDKELDDFVDSVKQDATQNR